MLMTTRLVEDHPSGCRHADERQGIRLQQQMHHLLCPEEGEVMQAPFSRDFTCSRKELPQQPYISPGHQHLTLRDKQYQSSRLATRPPF